MISAFDPFGNIKPIGRDEVEESGSLLDDLCRRVEDGPTDPYPTLMALWIALTQRMVMAGTPPALIANTAIRIAEQASCRGQA
jgi:hypothetical protein